MSIRDPELFHRALRAAAAVTGVLRKGAAIGLAAGALTMAGCGPSKTKTTETTGGGEPTAATTDAGTDAAVASDTELRAMDTTCEDDPGYGSKCCTAERAAGRSPIACTPWGPPAPPIYAGEQLA